MRRYLALLMSMLIATVAQASDSSASATSKPIKPAAKESRDKEESGSSDKKDSKDSKKSAKDSKESKESKEQKEALQADELAAKIAEKLSVIRKDKEDASRAAPRPVVRPAYAPQVRRTEPAKAKEPEHGSAAVVAAMGGHGAVHWSYQGETGPQNWGKINPANAKCDSGDRQSPIDIRGPFDKATYEIKPEFQAGTLKILNNGHTIQINAVPGSKTLINGESFDLPRRAWCGRRQ